MREPSTGVEQATIRQHCKLLRLPTMGAQFAKLAEEALQQKQTPLRYLEALLGAEVEEREQRAIQRRLGEAHLPRVKTLEEFDFSQAPKVSAGQIRQLAEGDYIARAEPVLFLGVPAETAGALHHGGGASERTGGSQAPEPTQPGDGPMVAL